MPRILIVDDEPVIRLLLQTAFARAGYESVRTAENAAQAMELCRSESFDVLLSDVVMPGMNGHELARWVAANYPETRTALMSGYDLACEKCAYSPRCGLLSKPFRMEEAVAFVNRLFGPEP